MVDNNDYVDSDTVNWECEKEPFLIPKGEYLFNIESARYRFGGKRDICVTLKIISSSPSNKMAIGHTLEDFWIFRYKPYDCRTQPVSQAIGSPAPPVTAKEPEILAWVDTLVNRKFLSDIDHEESTEEGTRAKLGLKFRKFIPHSPDEAKMPRQEEEPQALIESAPALAPINSKPVQRCKTKDASGLVHLYMDTDERIVRAQKKANEAGFKKISLLLWDFLYPGEPYPFDSSRGL